MKYEPGYLSDSKFAELAGMFEKVVEAVDGLSDCTVRRSCLDRASNMDLMVSFTISDPAVLPAYLEHPLHLAIAAESGPHETARFSFDCGQAE